LNALKKRILGPNFEQEFNIDNNSEMRSMRSGRSKMKSNRSSGSGEKQSRLRKRSSKSNYGNDLRPVDYLRKL